MSCLLVVFGLAGVFSPPSAKAGLERYRNAETLPGEDGNAKKLGFREIISLDAVGDTTFVVDETLQRVAKVRMDYRESVAVTPRLATDTDTNVN
ncbi:MAG: hypothetical protein ACFB21_08660 [Opitutales bacterium]